MKRQLVAIDAMPLSKSFEFPVNQNEGLIKGVIPMLGCGGISASATGTQQQMNLGNRGNLISRSLLDKETNRHHN